MSPTFQSRLLDLARSPLRTHDSLDPLESLIQQISPLPEIPPYCYATENVATTSHSMSGRRHYLDQKHRRD